MGWTIAHWMDGGVHGRSVIQATNPLRVSADEDVCMSDRVLKSPRYPFRRAYSLIALATSLLRDAT